MTSNKQGKVTWEVRAVLYIFSVTEFLLFLLGLCFQQSLAEIRSWWSWEKLLHWDMKSITSKKKKCSAHLEYSVCSGNWRLVPNRRELGSLISCFQDMFDWIRMCTIEKYKCFHPYVFALQLFFTSTCT